MSAMTVVEQLARWLAPWESAYNDSKAISITVTAVHVLAMLWSGGLAIAADRTTLRVVRGAEVDRQRQLLELQAVHRPVLISLGFVILSGILLAAADIKTFAVSPIFWLKLGLVVLLAVNGLVLTRTERALRAAPPPGAEVPRLWRRLATNSWLSLSLWSLTLIVGVALVDAA
jgi:hypothetical protein